LRLSIGFDIERGGFLVELTTPSSGPDDAPVYSQTVITLAAIEQGQMDEKLDALLAMHLRFLGIGR
jgi:hypothetical protein